MPMEEPNREREARRERMRDTQWSPEVLRRLKPRIHKKRWFWLCEDLNFRAAGATPAIAYKHWHLRSPDGEPLTAEGRAAPMALLRPDNGHWHSIYR